MTEKLIQAGADVNVARTSDGETALILAAGRGHTAVVDLLSVAMAITNTNADLDTPLTLVALKLVALQLDVIMMQQVYQT